MLPSVSDRRSYGAWRWYVESHVECPRLFGAIVFLQAGKPSPSRAGRCLVSAREADKKALVV